MRKLTRRGFELGALNKFSDSSDKSELERWQQGLPVFLKHQCVDAISKQQHYIEQTEVLVRTMLEQQECDSVLAEPLYAERLEPKFISLGSSFNEGDPQEIEMIVFDVMDGENIIAEDLW